MKKAAIWTLIVLMVCLIVGGAPAQAASAVISFSGPDKVQAGGTYTYTYEIKVSSAAVAYMTPVAVGGAFELVSGGDGLMYDTIPDNSSGSSEKGTVTVRVKDNAKAGAKAILSASGEYAVLDENYNQKEYTFQSSFQASVISGAAPQDTAQATPSPTPELTPAATPDATPTPMPDEPVTESLSPEAPEAVLAQNAPPMPDEEDAAPAKSVVVTPGKSSALLFAGGGAVLVVAAGLLIALYLRRAGFKQRSAVPEAEDFGRRSSYRRRGRHRR